MTAPAMAPRRCALCGLQAACVVLSWAAQAPICRECTTSLVCLWARVRAVEIEGLDK